MHEGKLRIECVSDVTFNPIVRSIRKKSGISAEWVLCDISQHMQILTLPLVDQRSQVLIFHCTQEYFLQTAEGEALADTYLSALTLFLERDDGPFVIVNTVETTAQGFVGIDRVKRQAMLFNLNARLAELTIAHPKLRLVDTVTALAEVGYEKAHNAKSGYVMKLPYRQAAVDALADVYVQCIEEIFVPRKKVLAVDADNTLWGGILGEDGIDGVKIDPANYPGIAYWRFQELLKEAKDSGLVLALVSKNNDEDIVEAFNKLRMPLALDDFSVRKVNWEPKSSNIKLIAESLNLGLDSFVFIDDNPFEIEQVRHSFSAVDCYQFPASAPEDAVRILQLAKHLGAWRLTTEDLLKTRLYAEEVKRLEAKAEARTLEDYLKSLDIRLEYGINRNSELVRVSQLTNKTNQFNLTTKRYSEVDINGFMQTGKVYDFRIIDKYGDMGIVGVVILQGCKIDTFLMSCRALGREVESTMLKIVCDTNPGVPFEAEYIRSAKNKIVESFYVKNGFDLVGEEDIVKRFRISEGPMPLFAIPIQEVF